MKSIYDFSVRPLRVKCVVEMVTAMSLDMFLSGSGEAVEHTKAYPPRLYTRAGALANLLAIYRACDITFFGVSPMENGRVGSIIIDPSHVRAVGFLIDHVFDVSSSEGFLGVLKVRDALDALRGRGANKVVYDFSERRGVITDGQTILYECDEDEEIRNYDYLKTFEPKATVNVSARDLIQVLSLFKHVWSVSISFDDSGLAFRNPEEGLEKFLKARGSGHVENYPYNVNYLYDFVSRVEKVGAVSLMLSFGNNGEYAAPVRIRARANNMVIDYYLAPLAGE